MGPFQGRTVGTLWFFPTPHLPSICTRPQHTYQALMPVLGDCHCEYQPSLSYLNRARKRPRPRPLA